LWSNETRMHIAPTGGAAGARVSEAKLTPNTGQAGPVAGDSAVIRELAVADLLKLTQILQPPSAPEIVARVEGLIQAAVTAIREGRREWAVGRFVEAVTTDPSRAEELRSHPEIQPIRNTVDQLLVRLTNVARMDAETKLMAAERVIEDAGWQKLPHWETTPQALLQIGHRLLEAGGYANYIKTAELATTLQSAYWGASVMQPPLINGADALEKEDTPIGRRRAGSAVLALGYYSWEKLREKLPRGVAALWQRAPLLALLGAWLILGLGGGFFAVLAKAVWPDSWVVAASDFGFEVWGLGFLALVGFGFWAQVRKARR